MNFTDTDDVVKEVENIKVDKEAKADDLEETDEGTKSMTKNFC